MSLNERQQQQVDAIASLVTQRDQSAVRQGIELAVALGDQEVFAALLDGMAFDSPVQIPGDRLPNHRRYPTPERAKIFEAGTGEQALLDLAMLHLLAVSEHPLRTKVTSIALGTPQRKFARPAPILWIEGLERLTALTHLDLHLTKNDEGLDLSSLEHFPELHYLRVRGAVLPGALPTMQHLKVINGVRLEFAPDAHFPALESVRGQFHHGGPLSRITMPKLANVEARNGVRLVGFESLRNLWCSHGDVQMIGCRRVEHLRLTGVTVDAPDLRQVELLDRVSAGFDVGQLESLGAVKMSQTSKFNGGRFPKGTRLADPRVSLWGPGLTDLGNIGELPGLRILLMPRVRLPLSLEPLRSASELRVLDIRFSPGITDLTPLIGLPNLEVLVIDKPEEQEIPPELADRVVTRWRTSRPSRRGSKDLTGKA